MSEMITEITGPAISLYASLIMFIIFGIIGYLMYREIKYIDRESGLAQVETVAKDIGESLEELKKINNAMKEKG